MALPRPVPREGAASITVYAQGHPEGNPQGLPTREDIRKYVKHPHAITHFDREGRAVWPLDQFTQRRIRDGDVTTEPPAKPAARPTTKAPQ